MMIDTTKEVLPHKRREIFQRGLVVTLVVVVVLVVIAVEVALSKTMKKRRRETNKWAHCSL